MCFPNLGDDDAGLKALIDLAESCPKFLRPELDKLFVACIKVIFCSKVPVHIRPGTYAYALLLKLGKGPSLNHVRTWGWLVQKMAIFPYFILQKFPYVGGWVVQKSLETPLR